MILDITEEWLLNMAKLEGEHEVGAGAPPKYLVRQYRPGFVTGFENKVYRGVPFEGLIEVPFAENFKHGDFDKFTVSPYGDELMIEAHYKSGKHYVVGFALPENSDATAPDGGLLRDNWRYRNHES